MKNIPVLELYQAATLDPVSLAEVKTYLRIDGGSEDELLISMIKAATLSAEKYMKASILLQKWKLSFNCTVPQEIELNYGPVTSVDSVKIVSATDVLTTYDISNYYLTAGSKSIYFKNIPSGKRVEIIYTTGFADTAEELPELIRQGILTNIAFMYERKQPGFELNTTAKTLYNFYRNISI